MNTNFRVSQQQQERALVDSVCSDMLLKLKTMNELCQRITEQLIRIQMYQEGDSLAELCSITDKVAAFNNITAKMTTSVSDAISQVYSLRCQEEVNANAHRQCDRGCMHENCQQQRVYWAASASDCKRGSSPEGEMERIARELWEAVSGEW